MMIRHLTPAEYETIPWKNGGGISTTIANARLPGASAGDWSGVIWQLGRTQIVVPAPFSDLTGFERLQLVIGGSGLVLETSGAEIDLRVPFRPVRYDGAAPITSRLENGPVEVVNLIGRRDLCAMWLLAPEIGVETALLPAHHVIYAPIEAVKLRLSHGGKAAEILNLTREHALSFDGEAVITPLSGRIIVASIRER